MEEHKPENDQGNQKPVAEASHYQVWLGTSALFLANYLFATYIRVKTVIMN